MTPFFKHRVQTRAYRVVPLGVVIFTRCRFGLNSRRLIPVILVPTPPRYFALPRVSIWWPMLGFLSQYSQWAIAVVPYAARTYVTMLDRSRQRESPSIAGPLSVATRVEPGAGSLRR